jgi:hypothetical protein
VVTGALGIKKGRKDKNKQMASADEMYVASSPNAIRSLSGKVAGLQIANPIHKEEEKIINGNNTIPSIIEPIQEEYDTFVENQFTSPKSEPLSTFSIDVDNASCQTFYQPRTKSTKRCCSCRGNDEFL